MMVTETDLRARVAELEKENGRLKAAVGPAGGATSVLRTTASALVITLALALAPVATVGTWTRLQLVDTDQFVATFAPLAEDPAVQAFVADQVTTAITDNVDVEGLVDRVVDGVSDLGLPPKAARALELIKGPAVQGVRSIISGTANTFVASSAFADIWAQTLRTSHAQALAVIQGQPDALLDLGEDGTLSLKLETVIDAAKQRLSDGGIGLASAIPEIKGEIPLLHADALGLVRATYGVAVTAGYWMPWLVLLLLASGVMLARRRLRALIWVGVAVAGVFGLFLAGVGTGRIFFLSAVSPSIMPLNAAKAIFDQLTAAMTATVSTLILVGVFLAVGAWLSGPSRTALARRRGGDLVGTRLRASADHAGLNTGRAGRFTERWIVAIRSGVVAATVLVVFVNRPPTVTGVLTSVTVMLLALLAVELVRRPDSAPGPIGRPDTEAVAVSDQVLAAEEESA